VKTNYTCESNFSLRDLSAVTYPKYRINKNLTELQGLGTPFQHFPGGGTPFRDSRALLRRNAGAEFHVNNVRQFQNGICYQLHMFCRCEGVEVEFELVLVRYRVW
jgi:hypothetical protein